MKTITNIKVLLFVSILFGNLNSAQAFDTKTLFRICKPFYESDYAFERRDDAICVAYFAGALQYGNLVCKELKLLRGTPDYVSDRDNYARIAMGTLGIPDIVLNASFQNEIIGEFIRWIEKTPPNLMDWDRSPAGYINEATKIAEPCE